MNEQDYMTPVEETLATVEETTPKEELAFEEEIEAPTEEASEEKEEANEEQAEETNAEQEDPVAALRAEVESLRAELAAARSENERVATEVGEFHALFPDCPLSAVPDTVWDQVRTGQSLCAAYALYEKKREAAIRRAEAVNLQNAQRSAGLAGKDAPAEYFTPDEVRAMSPNEVRRYYDKITESMKSWTR